MVESVSNNAAISTLLRAQSTGTSAGIAALKSNQQATQAIIAQLQKSVGQQAPSANKAPGTALAAGSMPSSSLPRGSLVDVLV